MPMNCDIVTQERLVFSGEVDYVSLPGLEGRMGILPNHSSLLTSIDYGEVMIRKDGEEQYFAVGGGFAEVQPKQVIILADSAEQADEIDLDRAQQARESALKAMKEGVTENSPMRYMEIQRSLQKARIRIDVSRRRTGRRPRSIPGAPRQSEE